MSAAPEGTTFKGTAEVTVVVEMEISGDTTTGDIESMRTAMADSARKAVAECLDDLSGGDSWHRKIGSVRAESVKLTIDWAASK